MSTIEQEIENEAVEAATEEAPENDWAALQRLSKEADQALDADDMETYYELSKQEDAIKKKLDAGAKKAFTNTVEVAEPPKLSERLEGAKARLAEAEEALNKIPRLQSRGPGAPPMGATADADDGARVDRIEAFDKVEMLKAEVAELTKREPFADMDDQALAAKLEDSEIAAESAKRDREALANSNRPAAERRAARLEAEAMDTWTGLVAEDKARSSEATEARMIEAAANRRALNNRPKMAKEWRAEEARLQKLLLEAANNKAPSRYLDVGPLRRAGEQAELIEKLIADEVPIYASEIQRAKDEVAAMVTVIAPNTVEVSPEAMNA